MYIGDKYKPIYFNQSKQAMPIISSCTHHIYEINDLINKN